MKKIISMLISVIMLTLCLMSTLSSCEHTHTYGIWITTKQPTCIEEGVQQRSCTKCGFVESSPLASVGHTTVIDAAVAPSCSAEGSTDGSHCGICQTVICSPERIEMLDHTPEKDEKIFPTCESEGLTEGTHCGVCGAVINAQEKIPAFGHDYRLCYVINSATCLNGGTRKMACINCKDTYDEAYQLEKYNATQIYEQATNYVGEIITYTKSGTEYAIGSGIVYSADGKIITNYHVIEKAYSAKITINNFTYTVRQVLAYDKELDLAVIKIDARNLTPAKICTLPVSVGNTVFTIGSSKGLTNTCSQGIVSYSNRVLDNVTYIQHNAAISNGNSGGPLINEFGEVIGINTMAYKDSQNLNFAIFTSELSKLDYSDPMTMDELYAKEVGSPFTQIVTWLNTYGLEKDGVKYFAYTINTANERSVWAIAYDKETNSLAISSVIASTQYALRFTGGVIIEEDKVIFDTYGDIEYQTEGISKSCTIEGNINAALYTFDTKVTYSDYVGDASLLEACVEGASSCMQLNITMLATFLLSTDLGISISDLGFTSFTIPA